MKKIIHLSDLHIGYSKKQDLSFRSQEIVKNIINQISIPNDYVIVITGDLIDDATKEENWLFSGAVINHLKNTFPHVLVVPGNHDYGTGSKANRKYVDKFKEHYYGNTNFDYPRKDIIGDIAFLGLDSMESELGPFDKRLADGDLGKEQRERLKTRLNDDDVKGCKYRVVYLHHHPFNPRIGHGLNDADELGDVLSKNGTVDALLFGHNHNFKAWHEWGITRCYDAGSSSRKKDHFSLHRIINLTVDPIHDESVSFFGLTI